MTTWHFYRRMPVYLANGRRIGRLEEVGHATDVLHVRQGHLLIRDWYIPASAIGEVNAQGVRLNLTVWDLRFNRLHVPPLEFLMRQGATPGYEYTSPADMPKSAPSPPV